MECSYILYLLFLASSFRMDLNLEGTFGYFLVQVWKDTFISQSTVKCIFMYYLLYSQCDPIWFQFLIQHCYDYVSKSHAPKFYVRVYISRIHDRKVILLKAPQDVLNNKGERHIYRKHKTYGAEPEAWCAQDVVELMSKVLWTPLHEQWATKQ